MTSIQQKVPLSQSVLFDIHKSFFETKGVDSWLGHVPFYVTSNAVFVEQVVSIVYAYICENKDLDPKEPLYILELGSGSGKFMYMFLQRLLARLNSGPHLEQRVTYVGTDFTESIVSYWEKHRQFGAFVEQGVLDFALFNAESSDDIVLRKSGQVLKGLKNPLIVIANYLFDSLVHDAFRVGSGKIEECLITATATSEDYESNPESVEVSFDFEELKKPRFEDEKQEILEDYAKEFESSCVLMPTGPIESMNYLNGLSEKGVFLVSHDKGHVETNSFWDAKEPDVAFHGSISLMVNYDAMDRYYSSLGGSTYMGAPVYGLKTFLMWSKERAFDYPLTTQCVNVFSNSFPSDQFLAVKNMINPGLKKMSPKDVLSYLQLVFWDPDIVVTCVEQLLKHIPAFTEPQRLLCIDGLERVESLVYEFEDKYYFFEISRLWYSMGFYERSITLNEWSIMQLGNDEFHMYNVALSQHALGMGDEAIESLGKCLEFNPDYEPAISFLSELRQA